MENQEGERELVASLGNLQERREREDSHWGGLGRKGEREFLYYLNLRNDKNALGIFLLKKQNAVFSYFEV